MLLAKAVLPGLMVIRFCFGLARLVPVNIMSQQWCLEWHRLRGFFHWLQPKTGLQARGQSKLHTDTRHKYREGQEKGKAKKQKTRHDVSGFYLSIGSGGVLDSIKWKSYWSVCIQNANKAWYYLEYLHFSKRFTFPIKIRALYQSQQ